MSNEGLRKAVSAMEERGIDSRAIAVFERFYRELEDDATGYVLEDEIDPLAQVQALTDLPERDEAEIAHALSSTVVVKLNGGLGTSMGISGPKTALEVRDGLSFLDLIARQICSLRRRHAVAIPLLLMNSFRTREESLARLRPYPEIGVHGIPLDFMQSAEPKLTADTLEPVSWPADPSLEWCPPGHGDVYVSLTASGVLDALLENGYRYAFLSNGDNLGATCDPAIPAWMAAEGIPYVAEVCERTANDRKGGHLAIRKSDGRLVLRDTAMVAPGEEGFFADEHRHRYFHANNIWVDLPALADLLDARSGDLGLPIIVNRKTVDPTDRESTKVIQVESAMGGAIEVFDGARALLVPRTRFRPVKSTNELLLLRSDVYRIDEHAEIVSTIDHPEPRIDLAAPYAFVHDLEEHFPAGAPSLREASSFVVERPATFGSGVVVRGDAHLGPDGAEEIPDGAVLTGDA